LLDHGTSNRLREMTPAGTRRTEKEGIFPLGDEATGGELVDECAIHLLVEIKIKGVE
jgi:hypothetical protein